LCVIASSRLSSTFSDSSAVMLPKYERKDQNFDVRAKVGQHRRCISREQTHRSFKSMMSAGEKTKSMYCW
jgi:hypothetical protein